MRLVTRGDMDGLTCAVIISLYETIEDVLLVHPQEMADGQIEIGPNDIIANLPYQPGCAMWFDHHQHTATVAAPVHGFTGDFGAAPSAAHLVYKYYGGKETMPYLEQLVAETDRMDAADLTPSDVLMPQDFIKVGFTIDSRSGLGAFEGYFIELVNLFRAGTSIEEVLEHPEVAKRCKMLDDADASFQEALITHSKVDGNVVVTDFRDSEEVPRGNRFMVYALFPEVNVSVRLQWGPGKAYTMMTIGHSIFNRTCNTDVGELAARYGGGGVRGAGSIRLLDEDPNIEIQMVIHELKTNG